MAMKRFRSALAMLLLAGWLCPLTSCQAPPNTNEPDGGFCEDETNCAEGEVCVFDSEFNGTVCKDGALFGL